MKSAKRIFFSNHKIILFVVLMFFGFIIPCMRKETIEISSSMADPYIELGVPSFFRAFQDIALRNAEEIGLGVEETNLKGRLWVFTRTYVEFYRMPKFQEKVELSTWPGQRKVFFFPRFAQMDDLDGKPLAKLSSVWVLMDASTRRAIMRPDLESPSEEFKGQLELPGKVVQKETSYAFRRTIQFSDLDLNGHLNNVRYIELIMNLHDKAFFAVNRVKSILLNYESEIAEGEELMLYASADGTYVRGIVSDRLCFEANLEYCPK